MKSFKSLVWMNVAGLVAAALMAATASGQEITVKGGNVRTVYVVPKQPTKDAPVILTAPPGGSLYRWYAPDGVISTRKNNVLEIISAPAGKELLFQCEWAVFTVIIDFEKKTSVTKTDEFFKEVSISVGEGPAPPIPPDPKPPVPPDPKPSPLTDPGMHVLIVYEHDELTPEFANQLMSAKLEEWLFGNCIKDASGKPARLIVDKDANTTNAQKWVIEGMRLPRMSHPWIVVSNGPTGGGFQGPCPKTADEIIALASKYLEKKR